MIRIWPTLLVAVPSTWLCAHYNLPWWVLPMVCAANLAGFVEGWERRGGATNG